MMRSVRSTIDRVRQSVKSSRSLFLMISLMFLVSDIIFVTMNYHFSKSALQDEWEQTWRQTAATYDLAVADQLQMMLLLAEFVGQDEEVRELFLAGARAVEAEGGGPGGPRAAAARQALYQRLKPAWERVSTRFDVRQLHFHLGPGSLSFLRVHRPDRFGDRMDDLRHIIVDTIAEGVQHTGFETGRVYSGLRGVIPLGAREDGRAGWYGALEVGISFETLVGRLDEVLGGGVTVLLRRNHVDDAMWREFAADRFAVQAEDCDCAIEASSRSDIAAFMDDGSIAGLVGSEQRFVPVRRDGRVFLLMQIPLRDYLGERDAERPPVGSIIVWNDVTHRVAGFRTDQWVNIAFGLGGWAILEVLLFAVVRYLARARHRAESASRTKGSLLSIMSHELRTPLNAVIGFSDLLAAGIGGDLNRRQTAYLRDIQAAGSKLLTIVNDILHYAHIEGGAHTPKQELVDARQTLDLCVERTRVEAAQAGVDVTVDRLAAPLVRVDEKGFERVLGHLVAIAVAATPRGAAIHVSLTEILDTAVIAITDGGDPLSRDQADLLLHPLDSAVDAHQTGLGEIGFRLALAKAFALAHGGLLHIRAGDDGGNTITMILPRVQTVRSSRPQAA